MEKRITPGQAAYIEDCRRKPYYIASNGARIVRRTWDQLGDPEKRTWELNPTARPWPKESGNA